MSHTFLDNYCDLPAKFLISFLNNACVVVKPWIETAANMKERNPGFGKRGQIIEWLRFCQIAAQHWILTVNTRHFVRIFNCPGVSFSGCNPGTFHHWLL